MTTINLLRIASDQLGRWRQVRRTILKALPLAFAAVAGCRDVDTPTAPAPRANALVASVSNRFIQLSGAGFGSCALRSDGVVECWGYNGPGQVPATRSATTGTYTQISVGGFHSCALRSDGVVECWGANQSGAAPATRVATNGRFTAVAVGNAHTCALREDGVVECWGFSDRGQAPAIRSALSGHVFTQVSGGGLHTCALREDGVLECWGSNDQGQAPAIKTAGSGVFTQVGSGYLSTCAVRSDGLAECFGWNAEGQAPATKAPLSSTYTQVDAESFHSCALRATGIVECWGTNQGGDTPATKSASDGHTFTEVDVGIASTCGLRDDGVVECWGHNDFGEGPPLKTAGNTYGHVLPTASFSATPASVSAGASFILALGAAQVPGHPEATSFTYAFDCGDGSGYGAFTATSTATCSTSATGTRTVKGTVRDQDNDVTEYTATVEITAPLDNTPPVITPTITGTLGNNDWYTSDVTITWSVTDAESAVTAQTGCGPTTISGNMHSLTLTCSATSAGGTASRDTLVKYDAAHPMITFASIQGTPNTAGWTPGPQRILWSCSDRDSGVISETVSVLVSTEGANQSATGICTDRAGNTAQNIRRAINIDLTSPTLAPTVSPSVVVMNGTVTVTPNALDALSGLASAICDTPNTSTVGTKTVQCTAVDNAGRRTSASVSYTVTYQFGAFSSPIVGNGILNVAKAGQSIPLKWRLLDAAGLPITTATNATVTVANLSCALGASTDAVEEYSSGASGLQNLGDGYYQYNWKTPKDYAGSCKTMQLDLGEGLTHTALFQFTK